MREYYHPKSGKKIKIEESHGGVMTSIVETSARGIDQSLSMKSEDIMRFEESLITAGWLPRQML